MSKPTKTKEGTWQIRWIDADDKRRAKTYADYREAVAKLREFEQEAAEIKAGLRRPAPPDKTWEELVDAWFAAAEARNKSSSMKSAKSRIRAGLTPFFGKRKIREIDATLINVTFKKSLEGRTTAAKRQFLTYLRTLLRYAKSEGWIWEVPKIEMPRKEVTQFHYLHNLEEVSQFLLAARDYKRSPTAYYLYTTAIYTGMRKGELAGLEWGDVDLVNRIITVRKSFDQPTKNYMIRRIPILDPLLPVLKEWKLRSPGKYVFVDRKGRPLGEQHRNFRQHFETIVKVAGFPDVQRFGRKKHYIRFHDLRATFASLWAMSDGSIFKLKEILGHQNIEQTMKYAHLCPKTYREDYDRLGTHAPGMDADIIPILSAETS